MLRTLCLRKCQLKPQRDNTSISIFQKLTSAHEHVGQLNSHTSLEACRRGQLLLERVWQLPLKLNTHLPHAPVIPLLGIDLSEQKRVRTNSTGMFMEALLLMTKAWRRPKYPSAGKSISQLPHVCAAVRPSAIKRKVYVMTWTSLKFQSKLRTV